MRTQFFNPLPQRQIFLPWILTLLLLLTAPATVHAQFRYTTNNGTITITGYTGPGGAVVIPSSTNGYPVTSIGTAAFQFISSITSVTIPNSIASIGTQAFRRCSGLTDISIPEGVTSIGDQACFECARLTSITIPGTVTNIGTYAFAGCQSLDAITVSMANSFYSSTDGILFNHDQTTLIQFPGAKAGVYVFPNTVTNMANDAFYRCGNLTSVTIASNITSITSYAFGYCTNLTSVVIPENLTSIANNAFYICFRLPDVTIPDTVTNIGNAAFASCGSLTNVNIPASVRTIDQSAFDSCTNLVKATVGKGVIGIQSYVFARCAKLPCISIPDSVTSIGDYAFYQCGSLTNVTLPRSVTNIGIYAFGYCSNLVNVTIPESVVRIADFAFSGCYSLAGAYFRGDAPSFGNPSGTGGLLNDTNATVYYLPGTTGWDQWVSPPPAVLWDPRVQSAGVQASQFGFVISGTANIPIVVEAATDMANASWTALQTCTLTNGMVHFSDTQWTNYPARFYRIRSP